MEAATCKCVTFFGVVSIVSMRFDVDVASFALEATFLGSWMSQSSSCVLVEVVHLSKRLEVVAHFHE